MFTNKTLIEISGMSPRTFYRRLEALRNQKIIPNEDKYYMDDERAKKIAEQMGFTIKFEIFLNKLRGKT